MKTIFKILAVLSFCALPFLMVYVEETGVGEVDKDLGTIAVLSFILVLCRLGWKQKAPAISNQG